MNEWSGDRFYFGWVNTNATVYLGKINSSYKAEVATAGQNK